METPNNQKVFKIWQKEIKKNEEIKTKITSVLPGVMAKQVVYIRLESRELKVFIEDATHFLKFMAMQKKMIDQIGENKKIKCKITVVGKDFMGAKQEKNVMTKSMPKAAKKAFKNLEKTLKSGKLKETVKALQTKTKSAER